MQKVLLVEPNLLRGLQIEKVLKIAGIKVLNTYDYISAVLEYKSHQPDVIICSPFVSVETRDINVATEIQKLGPCKVAVYSVPGTDVEKIKRSEHAHAVDTYDINSYRDLLQLEVKC